MVFPRKQGYLCSFGFIGHGECMCGGGSSTTKKTHERMMQSGWKIFGIVRQQKPVAQQATSYYLPYCRWHFPGNLFCLFTNGKSFTFFFIVRPLWWVYNIRVIWRKLFAGMSHTHIHCSMPTHIAQMRLNCGRYHHHQSFLSNFPCTSEIYRWVEKQILRRIKPISMAMTHFAFTRSWNHQYEH